ncbi:MAG: substrate-binding domain-containing protein [Campylobacteraceae bacterium]|nr:substrate-binding domain-containing protein [Campylobacteraceae bacterium]
MNRIVFQFFIFFILFTYSYSYSSMLSYHTKDDYFKNNKIQAELLKSFENIIHSKAIKLDKINKKKIKIVMIYPSHQISDYWERSKKSFIKRMNELNISYELIFYSSEAANDLKLQSMQLKKVLKIKADYLIFTLNVLKQKKFIERVFSQSKTKIILQNITTPLKKWNKDRIFLYLGFDHIQGSEIIAKEFIKKIGNIGSYSVFYGNKGYVSLMRGKKFIEYISRNSDLKLESEYYTYNNKDKAKKATLDLLNRNENIKFIYSCTTDIAMGVIEALKEKNLLNKITHNAWGGGSVELEAISKKELDFTIMRMNDDNGVAMAEAIKLDLLNHTNKVPQIFSGSFKLIDKNIKEELLEEYKKEAFRYSNE